jgi:hypothetical protein
MRGHTDAEFRTMRTGHRNDFRLLLSFIIGLAATGLAIMAHGFHWWP